MHFCWRWKYLTIILFLKCVFEKYEDTNIDSSTTNLKYAFSTLTVCIKTHHSLEKSLPATDFPGKSFPAYSNTVPYWSVALPSRSRADVASRSNSRLRETKICVPMCHSGTCAYVQYPCVRISQLVWFCKYFFYLWLFFCKLGGKYMTVRDCGSDRIR